MSGQEEEFIDDELANLLSDLEGTSYECEENAVADKIQDVTSTEIAKVEIVDQNTPKESKSSTVTGVSDKAASEIVDLDKFINDYESDYAAIKNNLSNDRKIISDVVMHLHDRLVVTGGGGLEPEELESLVKAVQVLADTNGHSVKLLDTKSKLLSSVKSGVSAIIQNIQANGGNPSASFDLSSILKQDEDEDKV